MVKTVLTSIEMFDFWASKIHHGMCKPRSEGRPFAEDSMYLNMKVYSIYNYIYIYHIIIIMCIYILYIIYNISYIMYIYINMNQSYLDALILYGSYDDS